MNTSQLIADIRKSQVDEQKRTRRWQTAAVVVVAAVIAVVIAVDVVRTAPADAPVAQVSFDAAPPVDDKSLLAQPAERFDRWAADDSARGTRPDGVH